MDIQVLASGSKGNCYRVDDGTTPILLECGIGYRDIQKATGFGVRHLKGCLVTHEHMDHAKAVAGLLRSMVPVYMSRGTKEALGIDHYDIRVVEHNQQFKVGSWTIKAFETKHDAAEPLGFLLLSSTGKKLLYATDTFYLEEKFRDVTHLMIECNYAEDILEQNFKSGSVEKSRKDRLYSSHFNLRRLKEFIRANTWTRLEEVHLIHLSDENSDAERFKREIAELTGVPVYVA